MEKTRTRGNIIIDDIKVGDIIYECEYGRCVKTQVITLPTISNDYWEWKSINLDTGKEIDYGSKVGNQYSHYGLNLYSYQAYGFINK